MYKNTMDHNVKRIKTQVKTFTQKLLEYAIKFKKQKNENFKISPLEREGQNC